MRHILVPIIVFGIAVTTAFSQPRSHYSPNYKYTNLQLDNLSGPVEKLVYADEESFTTFDRNGNIIQEKDKYVEKNYTYNKKGYVIHNQHGGLEGEWHVIIDENNHRRIDKRVDGQSNGEVNTYSFDEKGRHIATLFEEKGRTVIVSIHYASEETFLPDSSWVTTYYSGYIDDETVIAYWYNRDCRLMFFI